MTIIPRLDVANPNFIWGKCPCCKADWKGQEIPRDMQEHYKPPYFWSRIISLTTLGEDRTSSYGCPDCGTIWNRDTGIPEIVNANWLKEPTNK